LIPSTFYREIAASSQAETYSTPISNSITFISIVDNWAVSCVQFLVLKMRSQKTQTQ